MIEVSVVGELNLDLILYGLPQDLVVDHEHLASGMKLTLGSSSAIFAHNLSVLGTKVGFVTKYGDDFLGQAAAERLSVVGVDLSRTIHGAGKTPTGITLVAPHGKHRFILTYPGTMFEMEYADIQLDYVLSARHLHLSSFFLQRALRPRIPDLFREAKRKGLTTSLDTNDDPEDRWGTELIETLKYVDIFFPNEREAKKITGKEDFSQALDRLSELTTMVVVKRGSLPAICRRGTEEWALGPPAVQAVDDIGAGDTFDAGFVHLYLRGAALEDCLAFANIAAAYSVTREGGTEAFRDRDGLWDFIGQHWDRSPGALPAQVREREVAQSRKL